MIKNAESIVKAYSAQASSYIEAENGIVKLDENMPEAKEEVYLKSIITQTKQCMHMAFQTL
jgi:hypothetical protein